MLKKKRKMISISVQYLLAAVLDRQNPIQSVKIGQFIILNVKDSKNVKLIDALKKHFVWLREAADQLFVSPGTYGLNQKSSEPFSFLTLDDDFTQWMLYYISQKKRNDLRSIQITVDNSKKLKANMLVVIRDTRFLYYQPGDKSGILVHFRLIYIDEKEKTFMYFSPDHVRKYVKNAHGKKCSGPRIDKLDIWKCGNMNPTSKACDCLSTASYKDLLTSDFLYSRIGKTIEMEIEFKMHLYLCPRENNPRMYFHATDTNMSIPFHKYEDRLDCLETRFCLWFDASMHTNQARTKMKPMTTADLCNQDNDKFEPSNFEYFDIEAFFTDSAAL